MPANKFALLRYRIIDRMLSNGVRPYVTKEELRDACEEALYGSTGEKLSLSTIEKDLWAMRNESELGYYAPIAYHKKEKGYYYESEDYTIQDISLSAEDLEALRFATSTLMQFRDIPIFSQYEHAIEKIVNRLNIHPGGDQGELEQYVQFEKSEKQHGTELLSPLLQAIRERKKLSFRYRKFNNDSAGTYELCPYLLKEYRNRWYLIAYSEERDRYLTFGLERMESPEILDLSFDWNESFDPDRFFRHSVGITQVDGDPSEVLLSFDVREEPYLRTQQLHTSQQIVRRGEKELLVRLYVLETYELDNLILGFGPRVEVLAPESMRLRISVLLEESLKKYRT
jgi:predicted DNA-binding transcriptional regulator YafY